MYQREWTVPEEERRASGLFRALQALSRDAVAQMHATGEEIAPLGLMWVVVRYDIRIRRALIPGETLLMETWANPVRHAMSQRNYRITDPAGETVLEGAGIWAIADRETRALADPAERGVFFETEINGREGPRPLPPARMPLTEAFRYTVTQETLDINGHMNNTRYFDLAEDALKEETGRAALSRAQVVYEREARLGDELDVQWGREGNRSCFVGEGPRGTCFRMSLQYGE